MMTLIRSHPRLTLWLWLLLWFSWSGPPFIEGYLAYKWEDPEFTLPPIPFGIWLVVIAAVEFGIAGRWANAYIKEVKEAGRVAPSVGDMFGPAGAKWDWEAGAFRWWRWDGAYWVRRRRTATVTTQWPMIAKDSGLIRDFGIAKATIRPRRPEFDVNNDWSCRLYPGRLALSVEGLEGNVGRIAGSVDCKEAAFVRDDDGSEGRGTLKLWWSSPLSRSTTLADLPVINSDMLVSYGSRRSGVATLRKDRSAMFAGMTGQGKSNLIWVLIACLLAQGEWVNLYVADNKGGIELTALEEFAGALAAGANHDPQRTPARGGPVYDPIFTKQGQQMGRLKVIAYVSDEDGDDTIELLLPLALADLKARRRHQRRPNGPGRKLGKSSQQYPLSIVIIDEVTLIDEELKKGTKSNIGKIMSGGRASLFSVWLCTQDARATTIPASLRTLIATRIGFKMDNIESINAVFGSDAVKRGAKCHLLHEINDRGVCFSMEEGKSIISRVRTPFVPDAPIKEIVRGQVPKVMLEASQVKTIQTVPFQKYKVINRSAQWLEFHGLKPAYIGINHHGPMKDGQIRTYLHRAAEHMYNGEMERSPEYAWCEMCRQRENWWAKHCDPNDPDVTFEVVDIEEGEEEARKQERRDIRVLNPVFNIQHKGAKRTWTERFIGWKELHSPARKKELVAAGALGVDDEGEAVLPGDDGVILDPNIDGFGDDLSPRAPHTRQPIDGSWSE